jgi:Spy/CpxP family protein refolding chaperone
MNVLRHWKILLSLVAIFLVGAVTGGLLTLQVVKHEIRKRTDPQTWATTTLKQFQQRLELSPEQADKLRPIFDQRAEDLKQIRNNTVRDLLLIVQETNEQVDRELTPEQQAKFDQLKQELRNQLRERFKARPPQVK